MERSTPGISQIGGHRGEGAAKKEEDRDTLTGDELAAASSAYPLDEEPTRDDHGSGRLQPFESDEPGEHY